MRRTRPIVDICGYLVREGSPSHDRAEVLKVCLTEHPQPCVRCKRANEMLIERITRLSGYVGRAPGAAVETPEPAYRDEAPEPPPEAPEPRWAWRTAWYQAQAQHIVSEERGRGLCGFTPRGLTLDAYDGPVWAPETNGLLDGCRECLRRAKKGRIRARSWRPS